MVNATAGVVTNPGTGSSNRLLFVGPPPPLTLSVSGPSAIGFFSVAGGDRARAGFVPRESELVTYAAVYSGFMPSPTFSWSERFCWDGYCPGWTPLSVTGPSFSRTLYVDCSDDGNQYQVRLVMANADGRTATASKTTYLCSMV